MIVAIALALGLEGPVDLRVPAVLSGPARACTLIDPRVGKDQPIVAPGRLTMERGRLYALLFVGGLPMGPPYGTAFVGGIYTQLDDDAPSISSFSTRSTDYFYSIRFLGMKLGAHRLAFGLVGSDGAFVALGQRCFVAHDLEREEYDVTVDPNRP